MKKYFNYFIYISLAFLVVALYRADYLRIPEIVSWQQLVAAHILLIFGFFFDAFSWQKALSVMKYPVSFKEAFASFGLSIFGKYLPGKVWVIAGRSAYIAKKRNYPEKELLTISFTTQFASLWVGITFGIIGILIIGSIKTYFILALLLWLFLTLIIFSKYPHDLFIYVVSKILKKELKIPFLRVKEISSFLPFLLLRWTFFTLAFYLFANSLSIKEISLLIGFVFPLANTLGIVVIFAPGGLGVREGVLTGFLKMGGVEIVTATSIAISSRLWFLIAEIAVFFISIVFNSKLKEN